MIVDKAEDFLCIMLVAAAGKISEQGLRIKLRLISHAFLHLSLPSHSLSLYLSLSQASKYVAALLATKQQICHFLSQRPILNMHGFKDKSIEDIYLKHDLTVLIYI